MIPELTTPMALTTKIGLVLAVLGTLVTFANFYATFIRYPIHRLLGGTRENYQWVSAIPLVGSLFLWISAALLGSYPALMWGAIVLSLLDPGGLPWFAATMIYITYFTRQDDGP